MKNYHFGLCAMLLALPATAFADNGDEHLLQGPKIGVDIVRDSNEASQPTSAADESRNGFGGRANVGYDLVVGDMVLVGAEVGIGLGGKTVEQNALGANGRYRVNPGLTYDATARLGIAPTKGVALYGRAGYRWLKIEESVEGQATGNFSEKRTEKGFTYGGGIELAVSENFSVRGEFNRTKFNDDLRQNKFSLGASFRF